MTVRVLLADEADLVLIGIQCILTGCPDIEVVSTVRSLDELLGAARDFLPHVILFNERLDPLTDVVSIAERLRMLAPQAHLIILGNSADGFMIRTLFDRKARAYLYLADDLGDCLIPAIKRVVQDRPYLSPTANSEYLVAMQQRARKWHINEEARTILHLLAQGYAVSDIAARLQVAPRHVYWIREKLRRRFGASTNEHLIRRATAEGFTAISD